MMMKKWASMLVVLGVAGCGTVPESLRIEGTFKGVATCTQDIEQGSVLIDHNIYARPLDLELDSFGNVTLQGLPIRLGDELVEDHEDGVQRIYTVTEIDGGATWIGISYVTSSVGNEPNSFEGVAFEIWTFLADGSVEYESGLAEIINNETGRPIGFSDNDCTGILERE